MQEIGNQFKKKMNIAIERMEFIQSNRGHFRLGRELDFELIALVDLLIDAFKELDMAKKPIKTKKPKAKNPIVKPLGGGGTTGDGDNDADDGVGSVQDNPQHPDS